MITEQDVIDWLKATDLTASDATLKRVVASTNSFVATLPVVANLPEEAADWPDDVKLGAIMLAARRLRRRNSPGGVEAVTDAGVAYVARHDPDIRQLLRLDQPAVG